MNTDRLSSLPEHLRMRVLINCCRASSLARVARANRSSASIAERADRRIKVEVEPSTRSIHISHVYELHLLQTNLYASMKVVRKSIHEMLDYMQHMAERTVRGYNVFGCVRRPSCYESLLTLATDMSCVETMACGVELTLTSALI
jgi:hypothetical protein